MFQLIIAAFIIARFFAALCICQVFVRKVKGRDHLWDLCVGGRI